LANDPVKFPRAKPPTLRQNDSVMNPVQIARLRERISAHPKLDGADKAELLALLPEVPHVPTGEMEHDLGKEIADVGRELQHAVRQFEARHSGFTDLADKVLHFLARMGI
jgi:hypothetical protein